MSIDIDKANPQDILDMFGHLADDLIHGGHDLWAEELGKIYDHLAFYFEQQKQKEV